MTALNQAYHPTTAGLERETRFGAYSVVLRNAASLRERIREVLDLALDDLYLEVHVPDSVTGSPRAVLTAFKDGVIELADFLLAHDVRPKCLIGITHENVARPAQRFLNFQVIAGIPSETVTTDKTARVDEGYLKTKRAADGVPRGPLCLCYQTYESFMAFTSALRTKGVTPAPG